LPGVSHAFGDEGHEAVALVARTQMNAQAIAEADRLLSMDKAAFKMRDGGMTSDSWARQATWADYYRTSRTATGAAEPDPLLRLALRGYRTARRVASGRLLRLS
jgi:hypothetical protein